jgi:hypothetical protein
MRDNETFKMIFRGAREGSGTVNGEYGGGASMSSYSMRLGPFLGRVADGGTIIDKWNVEFKTAFDLAVNGPMVDVDLPEGSVDAAPEIPDYMLGPGGLQGGFLALAAVKKAKPGWRGLDRISLREYTDMWRSAGARIGIRKGDQIHWEDGVVEQIPPVDDYKFKTPCDEVVDDR